MKRVVQSSGAGNRPASLYTAQLTPASAPVVQPGGSKPLEYRSMRRLVRRAMSKGAERKSATLWEWDIAGRCESPVVRELWSRPSSSSQALAARKRRREDYELQRHAREEWRSSVDDDEWVPPPFEPKGFPRMVRGGPGYESVLQLRMHVRCRKCERCRKMRRADWYDRATSELKQAQRTWFGTLTFNDLAQFRCLTIARRKARARSLNWDDLSEEVQFNLHSAAAYAEHVQKFWKRVRKETGSNIRTLCVAEAGDDGKRLHFHVFVHECVGSVPVGERQLRKQWRGQGAGFCEFKLTEPDAPGAARYICKYIAKGLEARVRASVRYGKRSVAIVKRDEGGKPTPTQKDGKPFSASPKESGSCLSTILETRGE